MVGSREASLADRALERLLSGVNAYVPGQLVGPAEALVTFVHRTGVWPFTKRRFRLPTRILPRFHRQQRHRRLFVVLIEVAQNLQALRGGLVIGHQIGDLRFALDRGRALLVRIVQIAVGGHVRVLASRRRERQATVGQRIESAQFRRVRRTRANQNGGCA